MSFRYGKRSTKNLSECHPDIQKVFNEVIKHRDCAIIEGFRGKWEQNRLYAIGKSKLQWPDGKHNKKPSDAVDACPWPVDWNDREAFINFGGFVMGVAASMGIKLRWGGDWDMDNNMKDQTFDDLVHFERIG